MMQEEQQQKHKGRPKKGKKNKKGKKMRMGKNMMPGALGNMSMADIAKIQEMMGQ